MVWALVCAHKSAVASPMEATARACTPVLEPDRRSGLQIDGEVKDGVHL